MLSAILVPVSKLDFDLINPRYPAQNSQREAWEKILVSKPEKSLRLAQHIVKFGQNPIDLIAVIEDGSRYTVLEGNRRSAVLRALNKPAMLDSIPHGPGIASFIKQMKKLADEAKSSSIKQAYVVIFDSRDDADVWIQLKHTGENEGAGTVPWDGTQAARFRKDGDIGLQLIDFGKANGWFNDDDLLAGGAFPISTLNRLLGDPAVRTALGIDLAQGKLVAVVENDELAKGAKQVIDDLTIGDWNVTKLKTKADRQKYIDQFPADARPAADKSTAPWLIDVDSIAPPATQPAARPRTRTQSRVRTTLIPREFTLSTSHASPRLEKIYKELKKLTVDKNQNAVAVLLRTFIELSLDDLIVRQSVVVTKAKQQATLAEKAKSAAAHFKALHKLDKSQEAIVKRLVGDGSDPQADASSITTLHSFVHSRHANPIASELMDIWDNIAPFVHLIAHV